MRKPLAGAGGKASPHAVTLCTPIGLHLFTPKRPGAAVGAFGDDIEAACRSAETGCAQALHTTFTPLRVEACEPRCGTFQDRHLGTGVGLGLLLF